MTMIGIHVENFGGQQKKEKKWELTELMLDLAWTQIERKKGNLG